MLNLGIYTCLAAVAYATNSSNMRIDSYYQAGKTLPILDLEPEDVINSIVANVFPSPACDQFEEFGRDVGEAIDGLLEVLEKFGISIDDDGIESIKENGCEGPAVVVKASKGGDTVDAFYFPGFRDTVQFPTTLWATRGRRTHKYNFNEVFVGIALGGALDDQLAGSQYYYGYEQWTNKRQTIGAVFQTGSQPIASVEPVGIPRQQGIDFIVSIDGGKTGRKSGGGIYYTQDGGDAWVYDQKLVALFD